MDLLREEENPYYNGALDIDFDDDPPQGASNSRNQPQTVDSRKTRNYKLLMDPALGVGSQKVYRFDGVNPENVAGHLATPVIVRDPRSRLRFWAKKEVDIPLPKFKYDQYWVGAILPKEVTITNLNDNINQNFLHNMVKSFGNVEDCKIYFHPTTKKHLGIGKVLFSSTKAARGCAEKLNQTSKMGMIITVQVDAMGKDRQKLIDELTKEPDKPKPPETAAAPPKTTGFRPPSPPPPAKQKDPRASTHSKHRTPVGPRTPAQPDFSRPNSDKYSQDQQSHKSDGYMDDRQREDDHRDVGYSRDGRGRHSGGDGWDGDDQEHKDFYPSRYGDKVHKKDRHRDRKDSEYDRGGKYKEGRDGYNDYSKDDRHHRDRHRDRDRDRYRNRDRDRGYDGEKYDRNRDRDRHRERYNEYRDYDNQESQQQEYEPYPPPPEPEPPVEEPPCPPPEPPEPEPEDGPRNESLDSRIQSLLGGVSLGFGSPEHSSSSQEPEPPPPPLPNEPAPPLPSAPAPPLPDEPAPPPLPPEPDGGPDVYYCDSGAIIVTDGQMIQNGHLPGAQIMPPPRRSSADDDRMSIASSNSSGEARIQVNPAVHPRDYAAGMGPPPSSHMGPWDGGVGNMNYHNQLNDMYNQYTTPPPDPKASLIMTPEDEQSEDFFSVALDNMIDQLKNVMSKDLCKKMILNTAFSTFDSWWVSAESEKNNKSVKPVTPDVPDPLAVNLNKTDKPMLGNFKKITETKPVPTTSSLDALFESKDNSSMGGMGGLGGLLGLRGGVPKMPSFRRKFIRPPSPPPAEEKEDDDEDQDDEDFDPKKPQRPQTPDESEEEVGSDDEKGFKPQRKKTAIYSSDSEEDSEEASSEDEEEDSEEEEDEDEEDISDKDDSVSESSDVEVNVDKEDSPELEPEPEPETKKKKKKKKKKRELLPLHDDTDDEERPLTPIPEHDGEEDEEEREIDVESMDEDFDPTAGKEDESMDVESQEEEEETEKKAEEIGDEEEATEESGDDIASVQEDKEKKTVAEVKQPEAELSSIDKGRENDAIMALLQMHDTKVPQAKVEPAKAKPVEAEPPEYSCIEEHNYFIKGSPKKRQRKDSTPGSQFEEIPGIVLTSPDKNGLPQGKSQKESDETDSASEGEPDLTPCLPPMIAIDHQYCMSHHPVVPKPGKKQRSVDNAGMFVQQAQENQAPVSMDIGAETEITLDVMQQPKKAAGRKRKISDVTNLRGSRELANLMPPPKARPNFKPRSLQAEIELAYDFLVKGVDPEDMEFLRKRYELLLSNDSPQTFWLNETHWVDHANTYVPEVKKRKKEHELRKHKSGAARTEGYYKISYLDKHLYLGTTRGLLTYQDGEEMAKIDIALLIEKRQKKKIEQSREARSESRRWQNVLSGLGDDIVVGDLLKFNQLKFRKKQLKFSKSGIHDWGLFALEPIAAEEMVIEYVGQVIRQSVADRREKRYEQMGIGSSYMFRIDSDTIIDATQCGNLARFINHCCNPNCYAKIISVEGQKKIVIYSRRNIKVNEEITYDYKFPIEEVKIECLCGAKECRGSLN